MIELESKHQSVPSVGEWQTRRRRGSGSTAAFLLIAITVSGEARAAPSQGNLDAQLFKPVPLAPVQLDQSRALVSSLGEAQSTPSNQSRAPTAATTTLSSSESGAVGGDSSRQTVIGTAPPSRATSVPTIKANAEGVGGDSGATLLSQTAQQDRGSPTPVAFSSTADGGASIEPDQLLSLYQDGAGQAQTSMDELDLVLGHRQIFTDLRTLETRLNNQQRPTLNIVDRNSTQTDHLDINQLEISQDLFFSKGKDNLRLGAQRITFNARNQNSATQYAGGFTGNVRLNDIAAVAGEFWVNRLTYSNRARDTLLTYDVFVTLRPNDVIRIDIDTSRRLFDNIRSLQLGLTAQSYGGSIDYTPTDRLRLTARGFGASYDDQNRRRSEEVEAVWRAKTTPLIELGVRGTNFHFSRLLNNGYFNPRDYVSEEAMFRVQSELLPKFTVELAGSGGAENAHPGGVKPLIKGSLQAVYKLENGWSIDGEASHFTSRDSSSSGFARTSFTLGLHYRF